VAFPVQTQLEAAVVVLVPLARQMLVQRVEQAVSALRH